MKKLSARCGVCRFMFPIVLLIVLFAALAGCATQPQMYSVSYRVGDHAASDASVPQTVFYASGTVISLSQAPDAADGWSFSAWTDTSAEYASGASYTVTGDVVFTALWTPSAQPEPEPEPEPEPDPEPEPEPAVTFTVTFALGEHAHPSAEVPAACTAEEGEAVALPTDVAGERGYRFDGWYFDGERVSAPFFPTADTLLAAQFVPIRYTVTYDASGAENPNAVYEYTVEDADILLADATRRGYTFAGWLDERTGDVVEVLDTSRAEDIVLRALFTLNTYTIVYELGGGENAAGNPQSFTVESGDISLQPPHRVGYDFLGWTYEDQIEPQTEVTIVSGSVGDRTFTAHWKLHEYLLTVDTIPLVRLTMGEQFALPVPTRRPDSTFMGWMQEGELRYTPQENVFTMGTEDVTLTTRWADHGAIGSASEALAVFLDEGADAMTLASDIVLEEQVSLSRAFSLNLGGHTLVFMAETLCGISFFGDGKTRVAIENGTIDCRCKEDASARACAVTAQNVVLAGTGVHLISDGAGILMRAGELALSSSTITAEGEFAVAADRSLGAREPIAVSLSDSTLTAVGAESAALLLNGTGTSVLSDSALTGGRQGLVLRRGDASVSGCTIVSRMEGDGSAFLDSWGSGAQVPMAPVVIGDRVGDGTDANLTMRGTQVFAGDKIGKGIIVLYGESDLTGVARLSYLCDDAPLREIAAAGGIACHGAAYVLAGHIEEYHAAREVTCTSDGWLEYYYCPRCGSYFDGQGNLTAWEDLFLPKPAEGHFFVIEYDAASCVLSYGCSRGDAPEITMYLEITSDRGEIVLGEDAFSFRNGMFYVDLSAITVKGLYGGEKLVGFQVGGLYCAPDAVVNISYANVIHAVIDSIYD